MRHVDARHEKNTGDTFLDRDYVRNSYSFLFFLCRASTWRILNPGETSLETDYMGKPYSFSFFFSLTSTWRVSDPGETFLCRDCVRFSLCLLFLRLVSI